MVDILYFLFILVFVYTAFGHSFLLLGRNNSEGPLIDNFFDAWFKSYLIMDEYGEETFGDYLEWYTWLFFLLASFATNIVMMNLLISILGATYSNVSENYKIVMYKDMLHLIQENKYLINFFVRKQDDLSKKYLFMTIPVDEDDQNLPVLEKIDVLGRVLKQQNRMQVASNQKLDLIPRIEERDRQIQDRLEGLEKKIEARFENKLKVTEEKIKQLRTVMIKKHKLLDEKQDQILLKLEEILNK
mmetsp:Transcript_39516/g.29185  ORF Transcript_39516/g.29185 Transcript_39516/m.29185 type:complete len:244 (-) Transcript_39516:37-768(-)